MSGAGELARWSVQMGVGAFLLSLLGTGAMLALARRRGVLEEVNERSSHEVPTPSSGGLAIVFAVACTLSTSLLRDGTGSWPWIVVVATIASCVLGFLDDLRDLAAVPKLLATVVIAALAVPTAAVTEISLPFVGTTSLGLLALPLMVLWLSLFPHAFNFMDGINGIAALVAALVALAIAVWAVARGDRWLAVVAAATCGAALGFLPWNFPFGRIFMGDAGSLPLGLLLAILILRVADPRSGSARVAGASDGEELASAAHGSLLVAAVLLLAPFLFDVTFTLLRRARAGERLMEAHRSHLYQRLARALGHHVPATLVYGALTVLMMPAAWLYVRGSEAQRLAVLVAVVVVLGLFAWIVGRLEQRGAKPPTATQSEVK